MCNDCGKITYGEISSNHNKLIMFINGTINEDICSCNKYAKHISDRRSYCAEKNLKPVDVKKNCKQCGKRFTINTYSQKYCSAYCREVHKIVKKIELK